MLMFAQPGRKESKRKKKKRKKHAGSVRQKRQRKGNCQGIRQRCSAHATSESREKRTASRKAGAEIPGTFLTLILEEICKKQRELITTDDPQDTFKLNMSCDLNRGCIPIRT